MSIDHKEMYIYKNVIKIKHELPLYIIINTTFTPFLLQNFPIVLSKKTFRCE